MILFAHSNYYDLQLIITKHILAELIFYLLLITSNENNVWIDRLGCAGICSYYDCNEPCIEY